VAISIPARIQLVFDRIDALELRERILLLISTVVVLFILADSIALGPAFNEQQITKQRINELEVELAELSEKAELFGINDENNSDQPYITRREQLTNRLSELDSIIVDQLGALVEPTQAAHVLEQVVSNHRGLKLESLTASASSLDDVNLEQTENPGLGRYQLELKLSGSYLDILKYLQELEVLTWKFFWQQVDFQVGEYPHAVTRLQLYTLGARDG